MTVSSLFSGGVACGSAAAPRAPTVMHCSAMASAPDRVHGLESPQLVIELTGSPSLISGPLCLQLAALDIPSLPRRRASLRL